MNPLIQKVMDEARLTDKFLKSKVAKRRKTLFPHGHDNCFECEKFIAEQAQLELLKHPLTRILDEGQSWDEIEDARDWQNCIMHHKANFQPVIKYEEGE